MKHPRDPSPESSNKLPKRETDATNQLGLLLDFSSLTSHAEISARFDKLAESIFDDHTLCVHIDNKNIEYEILELEFYLHKSGCHSDPFTHQTKEQEHTGQWYFHRAPTRSSDPNRSTSAGYRGGTRKGLDLTFGHPITSQHFASKSSDGLLSTRGGILLRTIRRTTMGGQIISGPSLLVDEVLSVSRAESISDLVQNKWKNDSTALLATPSSARASSLYLKKRSRRKETCTRFYRTPRIGLELSHPSTTASPTDPRIIYISKPYRYIAYPNLLTSNGRCQTFLGIYQACLDSEEFEGGAKLVAEVVRIAGIKEKTVLKYVSDFRYGLDGRCSLGSFVGTKNGTASVSKYLNMMGALRALEDSRLVTLAGG